MSKNQKYRVQLCYTNWHEMLKKKAKNSKKMVTCYFMGFWTAFTDKQVVEFIKLCTKKDLKVIMSYPIWK